MNGLPVPPSGGPPSGGTNGPTTGPDQRLGRTRRLIRSALFDEAFNQQNKLVGRFMVAWLREGEGAALRLGVVTSRKVGGAVMRVRARRRLREVFRRNRFRLRGSFDLVLVARRAILDVNAGDIEQDFITLMKKGGLWSPE